MPTIPDFSFDRISFWLGFLVATIVWWVWSRIRPLLPVWRKQVRQSILLMQQRNFAGLENSARRETLRRAQHQHLSAQLFSLDEVLIEPRLIAPPVISERDENTLSEPIASQVVPFLPDWPELASPVGVPTITLAEALENGANIAVMGQPGSGKTVALAHLASQLARHQVVSDHLSNAFPILVHILDLDVTLHENRDPLQNLQKVVSNQVGVVYQGQVPRFFQTIFRDSQRKIILILDGFDELSPEKLSKAVTFLGALVEKQPRVQVVVAVSTDYIDGLTKLGFTPLGLAAWNYDDRVHFAERWGELWDKQFISLQKKPVSQIQLSPHLLNNWLTAECQYASPLEWTMRVWSSYAGDCSGISRMSLLDTHISRYLPAVSLIPALEQLGHYMVQQQAISLPFDEMEKFLSNIRLVNPIPITAPDTLEETEEEVDETRPKKKKQRQVKVTQGENIIDRLITGGVLVLHSNDQVRFANPEFLGYLAGLRTTTEEAAELTKTLNWVPNVLTLKYAAACDEQPDWVLPLFQNPDIPLCRNVLLVSRWLSEAPANAKWRSLLMRTLITLIQQEVIPLSTRARMIGAFFLSNDPSVPKLFKQLINSNFPSIRRIALVGCGALGNPQLIPDILVLLADNEESVRQAACLALAAIPGEAAMNAVVQVMLEGDEGIRQAAAEALALNSKEGHKVLEEAITFNDLLTRRAAVFGLLQVHQPWARKALEKAAVADGQWVVRNAASQALEMIKSTSLSIPKPLPPATEAPWLITFASRFNMGISPGKPVTDVLLMVLKSGSVEEQIQALSYLREVPEELVIREIYHALYGGQEDLREPAAQSLWWMAIAGVSLPSPWQYGLG